VGTCLSLTGDLIVARDVAHAKFLARLEQGQGLPEYIQNHIVYYAGPAKTPPGLPSGSFGPTTAGRMDSYADRFMREGASLVTLAKGNRSKAVSDACRRYGGFYLAAVGGPAALIAQQCIRKVALLDHEEDGMEAVFRITVEAFPCFIVVDNQGRDLYDTSRNVALGSGTSHEPTAVSSTPMEPGKRDASTLVGTAPSDEQQPTAAALEASPDDASSREGESRASGTHCQAREHQEAVMIVAGQCSSAVCQGCELCGPTAIITDW